MIVVMTINDVNKCRDMIYNGILGPVTLDLYRGTWKIIGIPLLPYGGQQTWVEAEPTDYVMSLGIANPKAGDIQNA